MARLPILTALRLFWGGALALPMCLLGAGHACAQTSVVLGAEDDAAPWSYADGSGYVNDLVRQAFDAAGWQVQLKVMPYARCKAMALQGQLAGCFSVSKTAELQNKLVFPARPVFAARNLLIAPAGSIWSGCNPLQWPKPPRIGVVRQYEYRTAVEALFHTHQARADVADSEITNLRKLKLGRLDATLVNVDDIKRLEALQAESQTTTMPLSIVCDFGSEPAYVAFSRGHSQGASALAAFEAGYAQLMRSGALARLQQTWRTRLLDSARTKAH